MRKFKNVNSGIVLTEKELDEMHLREWEEIWNWESIPVVIDMKEDCKTLNDFIEYMKKYDCDNDFEEIEVEATIEDKKELVKEFAELQKDIFKNKYCSGNLRMLDRIAEGSKFNNTYLNALQEFKKNTTEEKLCNRILDLESRLEPIANLRFGMVFGSKNKLNDEESELDNYREYILVRNN